MTRKDCGAPCASGSAADGIAHRQGTPTDGDYLSSACGGSKSPPVKLAQLRAARPGEFAVPHSFAVRKWFPDRGPWTFVFVTEDLVLWQLPVTTSQLQMFSRLRRTVRRKTGADLPPMRPNEWLGELRRATAYLRGEPW